MVVNVERIFIIIYSCSDFKTGNLIFNSSVNNLLAGLQCIHCALARPVCNNSIKSYLQLYVIVGEGEWKIMAIQITQIILKFQFNLPQHGNNIFIKKE